MIRVVAVLLVVAFAAPVLAEKPIALPDPVLVSLQAKLEKELGDLKPAPTFEIDRYSGGKSLVMRYKTRDYQVYAQSKGGTLSKKLHAQEGPDEEGVLLRIHVQAKGGLNQAVVPQTYRDTYWQTHLDTYPVADPDKEIFFSLSSRGHTDQKLIERIKKVLADKE